MSRGLHPKVYSTDFRRRAPAARTRSTTHREVRTDMGEPANVDILEHTGAHSTPWSPTVLRRHKARRSAFRECVFRGLELLRASSAKLKTLSTITCACFFLPSIWAPTPLGLMGSTAPFIPTPRYQVTCTRLTAWQDSTVVISTRPFAAVIHAGDCPNANPPAASNSATCAAVGVCGEPIAFQAVQALL